MAKYYGNLIGSISAMALFLVIPAMGQEPVTTNETPDPVVSSPEDELAAMPQASVRTTGQVDTATLRDPFWPVNFDPSKLRRPKNRDIVVEPTPEEKPPQWSDAVKTLQIKGVMKAGGAYLANINGQVYGAGESVSVTYVGKRYTWTVRTVDANGVDFQQMDVVPEKTAPAKPKETSEN